MSVDNDLRDAIVDKLEGFEIFELPQEGFVFTLGKHDAARIADAMIALVARWAAKEPE